QPRGAAIARDRHQVIQHCTANAATAQGQRGMHRFDLVMGGRELFECAHAEQVVSFPDRPKIDTRLLELPEVERMSTSGRGGGTRGAQMRPQQLPHPKVVEAPPTDFHHGVLFPTVDRYRDGSSRSLRRQRKRTELIAPSARWRMGLFLLVSIRRL